MISMPKTVSVKTQKCLKLHGISGFRHYGARCVCIKDGMNIDKSITRLIHFRDRGKGLKSPIFGGFSFCWDKAVEMKFGVGEETSSSYAHTLKR